MTQSPNQSQNSKVSRVHLVLFWVTFFGFDTLYIWPWLFQAVCLIFQTIPDEKEQKWAYWATMCVTIYLGYHFILSIFQSPQELNYFDTDLAS